MKRNHDKAFKEHAVNLWLGSGKTAQQVADELGIKRDRLYAWKHELEPVPPGGKGGTGSRPRTTEELQGEIARLNRENQMLRQQRDVLKKTLGILSEPPGSATSE